jgi:hypothetical protein
MIPDVSHVRTFGCVVRATRPAEIREKLDERATMGYLLGYKYDGEYRIWIPKWGARKTRDIALFTKARRGNAEYL